MKKKWVSIYLMSKIAILDMGFFSATSKMYPLELVLTNDHLGWTALKVKTIPSAWDKFLIKFKLMPGDLLMMDNYRLLHGRTEFNPNEGNRFLQGCYIDYDSSEGKLRHLLRKFIELN